MQANEYSAYDTYDYVGTTPNETLDDESGLLLVPGGITGSNRAMDINFDDPKIASMPKILLMGPRRGGKTSIQVRSFHQFQAAVYRRSHQQHSATTFHTQSLLPSLWFYPILRHSTAGCLSKNVAA